ncbi:MAG: lipopolysaccharide heptosyltransferase II [Rhodocyclaceae bacterium]|nr:lipopolysaccharide heptosyltransferase II [Rhodocyclaceae bacterium]
MTPSPVPIAARPTVSPARSRRAIIKILVVAPSWIGDTIMMQPLLMRLLARQPDAAIHVLAPAWSAPLLARMPEVTASIENPFAHGAFDWAGRRALGRRLKDEGFAESYVLPNSWKSALVPYFAGIKKRTGYTGEARYFLLNERHALDASAWPRLVDRYAALAGPAKATTPEPRLTSTVEQQRAARAALGLPLDVAPVVFCPGAEYGPAKRWPVRHFARLAKLLAQKVGAGGTALGRHADSMGTAIGRHADNMGTAVDRPADSMGTAVWIVGSAKDAPVGDAIARLAEGAALNLCGRTNLEQAIDLIAGAAAVVSNDSGLMHVAAALDRPLVALYGSSSPGYTPPLSARATILSLGLECSPCFKRECPLGHLHCLENLTPERVLAAMAIQTT